MKTLGTGARGLIGAVTMALVIGLGSPVAAQESDENLQSKRAELRELQQSLSEIRETAMAENPELQQQQDKLQTQVMSRMRDRGVEPRKSIRRLQDITRELRSGDVAEEDQTALMEEYQTTREEVLAARRDALDDDGVREAQEDLQDDLVEAMSEQDAAVPEMIERFEVLREEVSGSRGSVDMGTQR